MEPGLDIQPGFFAHHLPAAICNGNIYAWKSNVLL